MPIFHRVGCGVEEEAKSWVEKYSSDVGPTSHAMLVELRTSPWVVDACDT